MAEEEEAAGEVDAISRSREHGALTGHGHKRGRNTEPFHWRILRDIDKRAEIRSQTGKSVRDESPLLSGVRTDGRGRREGREGRWCRTHGQSFPPLGPPPTPSPCPPPPPPPPPPHSSHHHYHHSSQSEGTVVAAATAAVATDCRSLPLPHSPAAAPQQTLFCH